MNLLILLQAHALDADRIEDVGGAREATAALDNRKAGARFQEKPVGHRALGIYRIALLPPFVNTLPRPVQQCRTGKSIALFVLIHGTGRGKQVPQVVARPCRPREAVVDVESILVQAYARPCAKERLAGFDDCDRALTRIADEALRRGPLHGVCDAFMRNLPACDRA